MAFCTQKDTVRCSLAAQALYKSYFVLYNPRESRTDKFLKR